MSKFRFRIDVSELPGSLQIQRPLSDLPEMPHRKRALLESLQDVCNLFPDEPEDLCVFLFLNDSNCGPYSWFQVLVMLADRTITPDHMFFNPASQQWEPLRSLKLREMVSVFETVMALS